MKAVFKLQFAAMALIFFLMIMSVLIFGYVQPKVEVMYAVRNRHYVLFFERWRSKGEDARQELISNLTLS